VKIGFSVVYISFNDLTSWFCLNWRRLPLLDSATFYEKCWLFRKLQAFSMIKKLDMNLFG